MKTCSTCKKSLVNDVGGITFMCPACGKYEISRCKSCRITAGTYKCAECDFEGPN